MDPTSFDFDDPATKVQSTLTQSEMDLRDKFVVEYLKDYDALAACIRVGYTFAFAKEFSARFLSETYVLNKIKQLEVAAPLEAGEDDENAQRRKVYAGLWKEANYMGSGSSQSARVAALSKLSAFLGMDAPTRSQQELTGKNGEALGSGVLVIPGVMTAEQWAVQAEAQQAELTKPEVVVPQLRIA